MPGVSAGTVAAGIEARRRHGGDELLKARRRPSIRASDARARRPPAVAGCFEAGSMNDYEALPQARLPWSDQIRTGKFGGKQRPSPERINDAKRRQARARATHERWQREQRQKIARTAGPPAVPGR